MRIVVGIRNYNGVDIDGPDSGWVLRFRFPLVLSVSALYCWHRVGRRGGKSCYIL